jgi:hypothetical protein
MLDELMEMGGGVSGLYVIKISDFTQSDLIQKYCCSKFVEEAIKEQ